MFQKQFHSNCLLLLQNAECARVHRVLLNALFHSAVEHVLVLEQLLAESVRKLQKTEQSFLSNDFERLLNHLCEALEAELANVQL